MAGAVHDRRVVHDRRTVESILRQLVAIESRSPSGLFQFGSIASSHQFHKLYRVIGRHVPDGARVLDWGCGNGHLAFGLAALGYDVSAFGFEDFAIRPLVSDRVRFVAGDPSDPVTIPFPSGGFDAVVSVGVLEHVWETGGDAALSMREIARVLRPGGVFVCYHLPNRSSLIEAIPGRTSAHRHRHRDRYTARSIRALCAGSALDLVAHRRYAALPRNVWNRAPAALRRSATAARAWDVLDGALEVPLAAVCQNHLFVARKRAGVSAR